MKKLFLLVIVLALAAMVVASFMDISPFSDWKASAQDWITNQSSSSSSTTTDNLPHGTYTGAVFVAFSVKEAQLTFNVDKVVVSIPYYSSTTTYSLKWENTIQPLTCTAINVTDSHDILTIYYHPQYDIVTVKEWGEQQYSKVAK